MKSTRCDRNGMMSGYCKPLILKALMGRVEQSIASLRALQLSKSKNYVLQKLKINWANCLYLHSGQGGR